VYDKAVEKMEKEFNLKNIIKESKISRDKMK